MFDITENAKLVTVLHPVDRATSVMTTEWINMKNATKATFILDAGAYTSASSMACTLAVNTQASSSSAHAVTVGASTTLGFDHYYINSGDTYTKTSVSSSTFNITSAMANHTIIVEVLASEMGTLTDTSEYDADYVRLSVAASGGNALTSCVCLLTGLRYQQDSPPTAIT